MQVTIVISYFLDGNCLIVIIKDNTRLTALLFILLRLFTIIIALFLTHFYRLVINSDFCPHFPMVRSLLIGCFPYSYLIGSPVLQAKSHSAHLMGNLFPLPV